MLRRDDTSRARLRASVRPVRARVGIALVLLLGAWLVRRVLRGTTGAAPVTPLPVAATAVATVAVEAPTAAPTSSVSVVDAGVAAQAVPTGTTSSPRRPHRRLRLRRGAFSVGLLALAAAVGASIPGTSATLNDTVAMSSVTTAAALLNPPTALTPTMSGANVRVAYTAPSSGITPTNYSFYRSTTSGSGYGLLGNTTTSPYTDTTAAQCTTYYYTGRSNYASLQSSNATEASITTPDTTNPVINSAVAYGVNGTTYVPGYVKPGATVEVYANVTDNCSSGASLAVNFNFSGLGTIAATPGSYQPLGAMGPTYNYMFGPYTAPSLPDGYALTWTVDATDAASNTVNAAEPTIYADSAGPVINDADLVSVASNWFNTALNGAVSTSGSGAGAGYYAYANVTDAGSGSGSGASGNVITTNDASVTTSANAVALPFGSFATDNALSWTNRSAVQAPTSSVTAGTKTFTLTATDPLGNQTVSGAYNVTVDNTSPQATLNASPTCTANNVATAASVANTDTTDYSFDEQLDPGTLSPSWTGTGSASATMTFTASTGNDYLDDGTFTLFNGGTTPATGMDFTNNTWMNGLNSTTRPFASTMTLQSGSGTAWVYRTTFTSGTAFAHNAATATVHYSTALTDAAGNAIAAARINGTCATTTGGTGKW